MNNYKINIIYNDDFSIEDIFIKTLKKEIEKKFNYHYNSIFTSSSYLLNMEED